MCVTLTAQTPSAWLAVAYAVMACGALDLGCERHMQKLVQGRGSMDGSARWPASHIALGHCNPQDKF